MLDHKGTENKDLSVIKELAFDIEDIPEVTTLNKEIQTENIQEPEISSQSSITSIESSINEPIQQNNTPSNNLSPKIAKTRKKSYSRIINSPEIRKSPVMRRNSESRKSSAKSRSSKKSNLSMKPTQRIIKKISNFSKNEEKESSKNSEIQEIPQISKKK